MEWEIKYYLNENSYKAGIPAFTEVIHGSRDYVIRWIQNRLKASNFKYYDLIQK